MATLYITRFRRLPPVLTIAACLALSSAGGCGGRGPVSPNVLLVVVSGVRADHVSAYGYKKPTTPSLDALAKEGTLFENAITPAPWGPSAQASMATGLYMAEHGVTFDHPALEASFETLAEKLKKAGFSTLAVSTDPAVGPDTGFGQGFDSFTGIGPEDEPSPDDGAASAESALVHWLESRADQARETPFFATVLLTNSRLPFNPPGEYRDRFLDRPAPLPQIEKLTQLWLPFARQFTLGAARLTPDEMAVLIALYDGEIAYADYRLGRIVETLKDAGLLDETLVVVTSDSGDDLGDHGLLSDASRVYDSIVHVPLVMRLPGKVPPGERVADQVQTLDIGKSILALAARPGTGQPSAAPRSPLMDRRPTAVIESRFDPGALRYYRSIMPGADTSVYELNMVAVRTQENKYIITSKGTGALFDLRADPGEHKSVLADQAAKIPDLQARLSAWTALLNRPRPEAAAQKGPAPSPPPPTPAPAKSGAAKAR
ncbi:MAG TPA: sulfatase [Candidatus Polarisedimenticolia bacterium]